jgi:hypothetical protein
MAWIQTQWMFSVATSLADVFILRRLRALHVLVLHTLLPALPV